jgi:hypothetical protein
MVLALLVALAGSLAAMLALYMIVSSRVLAETPQLRLHKEVSVQVGTDRVRPEPRTSAREGPGSSYLTKKTQSRQPPQSSRGAVIIEAKKPENLVAAGERVDRLVVGLLRYSRLSRSMAFRLPASSKNCGSRPA